MTNRNCGERELHRERMRFAVGALFTVPLFVLSMGRDFGFFGSWAHAAWVNWLFLLLASPVQFYNRLGVFYVGSIKSIRTGAANMDVLVALGSTNRLSVLTSCPAFAYSW